MIALDTTSHNAGPSGTHTCTGSQLGLFVFTVMDAGFATGCQYAGVQMTLITTISTTVTGYLFFLANPSTGAHTVSVQGSLGNNAYVAASYTGMNVVLDSENSGSVVAQNLTVNTNVVASNCWTVGFAKVFGAQGFPITSNVTTREQIFVTGTSSQLAIGLADSNATVGTGSQGMTFSNLGASPNFEALVISIAPFAAFTNKSDNLFENA